MTYLNNKIPPPLIALTCALITWLLAMVFANANIHHKLMLSSAGLLLITGASFAVLGIACFKTANTTINPLSPNTTSTLVTSGIYRISRNPMYVGMAMILLAWSFYLGSFIGTIGPLIFITYLNQFQIKPEEQALSILFGETFIQYCSKVRRWL